MCQCLNASMETTMKTEEEKAAAEGDEDENPFSFFFDYRYASSIFYHLTRVTSNRQAS